MSHHPPIARNLASALIDQPGAGTFLVVSVFAGVYGERTSRFFPPFSWFMGVAIGLGMYLFLTGLEILLAGWTDRGDGPPRPPDDPPDPWNPPPDGRPVDEPLYVDDVIASFEDSQPIKERS